MLGIFLYLGTSTIPRASLLVPGTGMHKDSFEFFFVFLLCVNFRLGDVGLMAVHARVFFSQACICTCRMWRSGGEGGERWRADLVFNEWRNENLKLMHSL